jgi:adenosylcobinamide-GDP ribazoletransferase
MWNAFALAVQIVTGQAALMTEMPRRAAARQAVALLPLVGVFVGFVMAAVWTLASRLWPGEPLVWACLTLAASALATHGRPLGGVARGADGLASDQSGGDRSRALAVMRDPRRGTAGIVGLAVIVALKLGFLSALPAPAAGQSLILASTLGRWATSFAFAAFPLASASDDDPSVHGGLIDAGPNEFLIATVIALACAAILPTRGLLVLVAVAAAAGPAAQAVSRRLGGLTPPLCHALGECGELAALACLAIR